MKRENDSEVVKTSRLLGLQITLIVNRSKKK